MGMAFRSAVSLALACTLAIGIWFSVPAFAQTQSKTPETGKAKGQTLDAATILNRIDDLYRGESSHSMMTMTVKTRNWERSLSMEAWSQGKEKSLVKVLKPLKERGTATLKMGKEIYNYLPKTDRTIKLTAAMMGGSWMGSHFTNDDLVKESRMADDFTSSITFAGTRDGQEAIEITGVPRPDAVVVWGKVVVLVRAKDYQPLYVDYFDEDGQMTRRMSFSDFQTTGGRLLPRKMRLIPTDKPDESTEVVYEDISFDVPLADGFFSLNQLRR
ncbi:MAG: outer membrane lipoprotein-sorting protein [Myxococcales bacterium]|nr:MAG: outer membrane lipoprotein-sorting protein [Myxococcales bacterium]